MGWKLQVHQKAPSGNKGLIPVIEHHFQVHIHGSFPMEKRSFQLDPFILVILLWMFTSGLPIVTSKSIQNPIFFGPITENNMNKFACDNLPTESMSCIIQTMWTQFTAWNWHAVSLYATISMNHVRYPTWWTISINPLNPLTTTTVIYNSIF